MNLNPVHRAARNIFAGVTGVTDPASIELDFLHPDTANRALKFAAAALSGPFGEFVPVDGELEAEACECKATDGYIQALEETIRAVSIMMALSQTQDQVDILETFQAEVQARLDQVKAPEPAEAELDVVDLLKMIFGDSVQLLRA